MTLYLEKIWTRFTLIWMDVCMCFMCFMRTCMCVCSHSHLFLGQVCRNSVQQRWWTWRGQHIEFSARKGIIVCIMCLAYFVQTSLLCQLETASFKNILIDRLHGTLLLLLNLSAEYYNKVKYVRLVSFFPIILTASTAW